MRLKKLTKDLLLKKVTGSLNLEIKEIAYDSRKVKKGYLFVAIRGVNCDGACFIDEAVKNGALAVISEKNLTPKDYTHLRVLNTRAALSKVSAAFYNHPSSKLKLIGVTGTNGKTTVSYILREIFERAGFKTGLIGTLGIFLGRKKVPSLLTTPESLELQKTLSEMVKKKIKVVIMEVSSHSLALERVSHCEFNGAIFTNLTHDHLDFHKNMKNYLETKKILFKKLLKKSPQVAVINSDDPYAQDFIKVASAKVLKYGINSAKNIKLDHKGVNFLFKNHIFYSPLKGRFNICNLMAAISCARAFKIPLKVIKETLLKVKLIPGRMEYIKAGQPYPVIVDFAHSPDSLEKLLLTVKKIHAGSLTLVFGCPGTRDKKKRPLMAKIAERISDFSIVTTDDPHLEDPKKIIDDIKKGFKDKKKYKTILDRKKAIVLALKRGEKEGGVVVVAGRGHECYQDFKGKNILFDDRKVVRKLLIN